MHEMGIVVNTVESAEKLAQQYNIKKLGSITVDIGELTGVMPKYVQELWGLGTQGTICEGTTLIIKETPGIGKCRACQKDYNLMQHYDGKVVACPYCGADSFDILSGKDLMITELGIQD